MDWRKPDPALAADWVLAAAVAYEDRAFGPLIDCFRQVLRPGGQVLLSEPGRWIAKGWLRELVARQLATHVAQYEVAIPGLTQPVGVYRLAYAALQQI